jgi:hypothetical protein
MSIHDLPLEILIHLGTSLDIKGYSALIKTVRLFGLATLDPKFNRQFRQLFTVKTICPDGSTQWTLNGMLHREDGPVVVWASGYKCWHRYGLLHREDGPAIEWPDGTKSWWREGKRHREDGPAIEWADGSKEWWIDGSHHREDGSHHREDGPAFEWPDGTKVWYREGRRHREDGPDIELLKEPKNGEEKINAFERSS